jgi:hypothetical protein
MVFFSWKPEFNEPEINEIFGNQEIMDICVRGKTKALNNFRI